MNGDNDRVSAAVGVVVREVSVEVILPLLTSVKTKFRLKSYSFVALAAKFHFSPSIVSKHMCLKSSFKDLLKRR